MEQDGEKPKEHTDRIFLVQKMRRLFKERREDGIWNSFMKLIEIPMTFLRDYSTPMAEHEAWDRRRAAIIPSFLILSFFYLGGVLSDTENPPEYESWWENTYWKISLFAMIPGIMIGVGILFKTKKTRAPEWLMTTYAIICFVMSIMWIKFSSDCIMDILQLFGFVTQLPTSLFGLTILAWGNCLGDLSADVAMTKKGFGEMAITGTMAGPIFNVLMGMGLSLVLKFASTKSDKGVFGDSVPVSIYINGG